MFACKKQEKSFFAFVSQIGYNIFNMKTITKTDFIRARIEPGVKKESEKILKEIGLNMSDAIGIFLRQVNLNKGLPFSVNIPNKTTKKALGEDLSSAKVYKKTKDLFSELSK